MGLEKSSQAAAALAFKEADLWRHRGDSISVDPQLLRLVAAAVAPGAETSPQRQEATDIVCLFDEPTVTKEGGGGGGRGSSKNIEFI